MHYYQSVRPIQHCVYYISEAQRVLCVLHYVRNKPVPVYLTIVSVHTLVHTVQAQDARCACTQWLYNDTYTWVPIHVLILYNYV